MADDFQPSEMLCSKDYKKKKTVDFDYNINGQTSKRCWHTQGEVGQAQDMLVSLSPLDMILHFYE
jgi:hypothetical protein